MSYYLTAMKTDVRFKETDSDAIMQAIKESAKNYSEVYGWYNAVLAAKTLHEIASEFNIELYYTNHPEDCIIPIVNNCYASIFLEDVANAAAPYMENGYIEGLCEYGKWKVTFKDGKAKIKRYW